MFRVFTPVRVNVFSSIARNEYRGFSGFSSQLILKNHNQNKLILQRNFKRKVFWFLYTSDKEFKIRDKVTSDYRIIYKGSSINFVKYGYQTVIGLLGLDICGIALQKMFMPGFQTIMETADPYLVAAGVSFSLFIILGIHNIAKDYVYRIYYSEEKDKYWAIVMGRHPFAERGIEFPSGTLVHQNYPKLVQFLVPWKDSIYKTPDKENFYLASQGFEHLGHYNKLIRE